MSRPTLLDLFSGAGGAAVGYDRAGFDVCGVDHRPQPRYPFRFVEADALEYLVKHAHEYDVIHCSPPCQLFSAYRRKGFGVGVGYPDLIGAVRDILVAAGRPFLIENVPGSPLQTPVQVCGSSFGLDVRRHRWFESAIPLKVPPCAHDRQASRFPPATNRTNPRSTVEVGVWRIPLEVQQKAMGIPWMTREELSQAVPPAYTEHMGRQLLHALAGDTP